MYANSYYYFNDYKINAYGKATKTRTKKATRTRTKTKSILQTFLGKQMKILTAKKNQNIFKLYLDANTILSLYGDIKNRYCKGPP